MHDAKDPNARKRFSDRRLGLFFPKLIREKAIAAEKWVEQPTIEEANEMVHPSAAHVFQVRCSLIVPG